MPGLPDSSVFIVETAESLRHQFAISSVEDVPSDRIVSIETVVRIRRGPYDRKASIPRSATSVVHLSASAVKSHYSRCVNTAFRSLRRSTTIQPRCEAAAKADTSLPELLGWAS